MYEILKNIDSPADVKKLSAGELENLAGEMLATCDIDIFCKYK